MSIDRLTRLNRRQFFTVAAISLLALAGCGEDPNVVAINELRAQATAAAVATQEATEVLSAQDKSLYTTLVELSKKTDVKVANLTMSQGPSVGKEVQFILNNPTVPIGINTEMFTIMEDFFYQNVQVPPDPEFSAFFKAPTSFILWDEKGLDDFHGVNPVNPSLGAIEVTRWYKSGDGRMSIVSVPYDSQDLNSRSNVTSFATGLFQSLTNGAMYALNPLSLEERLRYKEILSNMLGTSVGIAYAGLPFEQYVILMRSATATVPAGQLAGQTITFSPLNRQQYETFQSAIINQPLYVAVQ